jgi:WD40 repeat protein
LFLVLAGDKMNQPENDNLRSRVVRPSVSEGRLPRVFPLAIGALVLGGLACLASPLGNIIPGDGPDDVAEEATPTSELAPTETAVSPTEAPPEEEEPTPEPMGISLDNAADVQQMQEFIGAELPSFGMKIAPNGNELAVFGFDGTIHIYDVQSGTEVQALAGGHSGPGRALAFSPDGNLLATGGEDFRLTIWDLESGDQLFNDVVETNPQDMTFTPDGSKLVFVGPSSSRAFVIDQDGRELGQVTEHGRALGSVDVSPDGAYLATGNGRGNIVISDTESLATITALNDGTGLLQTTKFSPDGAWLAAGSGSGDLWIWNTADWSLERSWLAHRNGLQYLAWSRDSSVLISAGTDGRVVLWDPTDASELNAFHFTVEVWRVDFAPDGSFIASLGGDRNEAQVRLFGLP